MNTVALRDYVFEHVVTISTHTVEWMISLSYRGESKIIDSKEKENDTRVAKDAEEHITTPSTFKTIQEVVIRKKQGAAVVEKNTVMYAHMHRVPVFKNPTIEYDGQIGEIPYGEMVIVLEPKGRFYHSMWGALDGWVLKDDIADRALCVHPVFVVGEENSVDHPNTAHVRTILNDVFGLGRSEFPLQAGEYVLYRLWKKSICIMWPEIRPRVPGSWHKILRGVDNVHIGVSPKVGSIMEYMHDGDVGHLAFVEAVFPDGTITISEANYPDRGIYNERELPLHKWKNLKPVFIEAT